MLLSWGPDWRVEGPGWPHQQHSSFVVHGGIRWHVQRLGSGPVLLLLHGTGASSHSFRDLMPLLARRFTVVAVDLPGHAFTAAPHSFSPSLPDMAAALADLLAEQRLSPEVVVGHSAGAAVLVRMALDRRIAPRLLCGLGAALYPLRGATWLFAPTAARFLSRSGLAAELIALQARDQTSVDWLLRRTGSVLDGRGVDLYRRLAQSPGHVAGVLAMLARWDLEPLWGALPRLTTPLYLLGGENDRAIPLEHQQQAASRAARGRLHRVPGTGHLLLEEQPELVVRLLLEELDRGEAAEPSADTEEAARR